MWPWNSPPVPSCRSNSGLPRRRREDRERRLKDGIAELEHRHGVLATAQAEGRDVTDEELAASQIRRDTALDALKASLEATTG